MDETVKYLGSDTEQQALLREQGFRPMYFSQKTNMFNVYFVKRGWAWVSLVIFAFASTYPDMSNGQRARALLRWGANTLWWFLVTQWFFGAPIIDRGFRWTGGKCELAQMEVEQGVATTKDLFTAAACKSSGGKWYGGHDISGHVFLLTLGSAMIMSELGWVMARWSAKVPEERTVITVHGETKSVSDVAETPIGLGRNMDVWRTSGKFGAVVVGLNFWMMLMTAMYFHTWFEKTTGLVTAYIGIYAIYIAPRYVPILRSIIGIPGVL
ncbi:hypothetical protein Golomagni_07761 [Golovinomyces magnicellulatus]|nr:hypothetical protein Golomagni_07761 [Golovinomyces magnicellulatus]